MKPGRVGTPTPKCERRNEVIEPMTNTRRNAANIARKKLWQHDQATFILLSRPEVKRRFFFFLERATNLALTTSTTNTKEKRRRG